MKLIRTIGEDCRVGFVKDPTLEGELLIKEIHGGGHFRFRAKKCEVLDDKVIQVYRCILKEGLQKGSNKADIVAQRFYLYKYLRTEYGLTLRAIGVLFGGYKHDGVLHGLKVHSNTYDQTVVINRVRHLYHDFPIRGEMDAIRDRVAHSNNVMLDFNKSEYLLLLKFRRDNAIPTNESAIKELLKMYKNDLRNGREIR